ncbi:MAG: ABC transporter ATP-binding protein [Chthoniobacteraceae bacterium]
MSLAIRIEQLSKRYMLGEINQRSLWKQTRDLLTGRKRSDDEYFWALRDISLDVREGEVLGILGHNGAGKSTLLKILSQITAPTAGSVRLKGRVSSLLEVGTGFHPELTGRDNVYLNGSILGMSRREVQTKFDEILAFSGVEEFIDTPVKRYSSGMRVRLAFAVAAHLESEILIIDEVLAVGDASFQQKCLGKVASVADAGRTVLFVSHNTAAVEKLCRTGVVLDHGKVVFQGTQTEALGEYLRKFAQKNASLRERTDRTGNGELRVVGIDFRDPEGNVVAAARSGGDVEVWLHFENYARKPYPRLGARIFISTHMGVPVFVQSNRLSQTEFGELPEAGAFVCRIPRLPLPESSYRVSFKISPEQAGGETLDLVRGAATLHVAGGDFFGGGRVPPPRDGLALVEGNWRLETPRSFEETMPASVAPLDTAV